MSAPIPLSSLLSCSGAPPLPQALFACGSGGRPLRRRGGGGSARRRRGGDLRARRRRGRGGSAWWPRSGATVAGSDDDGAPVAARDDDGAFLLMATLLLIARLPTRHPHLFAPKILQTRLANNHGVVVAAVV
uniref:Uncharacterized protein n=1 Tax=Oryza meridionalis TaxID=40149 RepID=A0A0E0DU11_9ORYZ